MSPAKFKSFIHILDDFAYQYPFRFRFRRRWNKRISLSCIYVLWVIKFIHLRQCDGCDNKGYIKEVLASTIKSVIQPYILHKSFLTLLLHRRHHKKSSKFIGKIQAFSPFSTFFPSLAFTLTMPSHRNRTEEATMIKNHLIFSMVMVGSNSSAWKYLHILDNFAFRCGSPDNRIASNGLDLYVGGFHINDNENSACL